MTPEQKLAELMGGRRFGPSGGGDVLPMVRTGAAKPAAVPVVEPPALAEGAIHIGDADDTGGPVGLDLARLIDGRLLIQGTSGAGKSWTLRRLLEQTHETIQQVIVDPEGELRSLGEAFGHLRLDGAALDGAALALAARRVREHRLSVLLDLSDVDREGQMKAVASFLAALVEAPREHWHPVLVAIDEAHLFAPFGGQSSAATAVRKAAIGAVTDLMSRGRKRGLCGILATQRLARLAKSVASEVHNFLIGLNTLDLDIRRSAETIGWDARRAFDRLPMLDPGDFVAVGPAFSRSPAVLRVGPVETSHGGAAPEIAAPVMTSPEDAARLLDLDALVEASAADSEIREDAEMQSGIRAVRAFARERHFALAARAFAALRPLSPDGARISDLAAHLDAGAEDVAGALELLDRFALLEFLGEGADRIVRIEKGTAVVMAGGSAP